RPRAFVRNTKAVEGPREEEGWGVEQAAEDAAAWSVEHTADVEREPMAHACQSGARVVTATPRQLSALRQAAEPVYTSMRKDPEQRPVLEKIEALATNAPSDLPLSVPEGCAYRPGDEKAIPAPVQALSGPGDPGGLPQGTYRLEHTPAELIEHGETEESVRDNAGVMTWTLRGGRWSIHPDPTYPNRFSTADCAGFYDVNR